jgi:hypothetical protein
MMLQQFRIMVDSVPTDEQIDAIYTLEDEPGVVENPRRGYGVVEFDRHAPHLAQAVASAVHDLEKIGLRPVRVVNEDWVTLGDIADRIGRSREMVRLWSTGRQGPGCFPYPMNPGRESTTAFYSWAEVAPWLREQLGMEVLNEEPVLAAANLALQLRALAPRISQMGAIRDLVPA